MRAQNTQIWTASPRSPAMLRQVAGGGWQRRGSGGSAWRRAGHLTQKGEYLSVEALGDLRGGRIVIGSDLAGDRVVSDTGSAIR